MSSSVDSAARLELLPNDEPDLFTTDDEDDNDDNDPQLAVPPPSRSVVFLFLLAPYLRLGAIYAFDIGSTSRTYGLTGLVVAASLSAFCRQIWFLLGRYLRKSTTEDILIHIFATPRHRRVAKHGWARYTFTIISGLFRLLLAAMYLRDAVDSVLLLKLPESEFIPSRSRLNMSLILSILIFVLSLPRSLASKSVVYTTGLSVASYLAWSVAVSRPSATNALASFQRRVLWNEISSIAFACSTAMTVPLSASLIVGSPSVSPTSGNATAGSFQLLNTFSTLLAASLMLPLVFVTASPRALAPTAKSDNLILGLRIATLVLSIPSVVVSITSLPLHGLAYRFIRTDLALSVIIAIIFGLNLLPTTISSILDDGILFSAVFASFLLPALAHITIHYFRRPLSIVMPQAPSSVPSTPRPSHSDRSPSPSRDPLLQRKERLLQRSRFGKRLLWDVVIWIVLIPICGYALVWATGRLARRW